MQGRNEDRGLIVIGLDLGDRASRFCALDGEGQVVERGKVATTRDALAQMFGGRPRARIALEVGTHSPWVSEHLTELGHEVLVANPRQIPLLYLGGKKTDAIDAEKLARIARSDPKLLSPITHRSLKTRSDLVVARTRDALVRTQTLLFNHLKGTVKSFGYRISGGVTQYLEEQLEQPGLKKLAPALIPLIKAIKDTAARIRDYERQLKHLAETSYPEVILFRKVSGIGPITSITYVLTIEDPRRFKNSRDVGSYLGLTPQVFSSGMSNPQLSITKAGDRHLRCLLVQCAHRLLGPFSKDCELRRHGLTLVARGGKGALKRAVVAIARKLAVLLHRLWTTGEEYDPWYETKRRGEAVPTAAA